MDHDRREANRLISLGRVVKTQGLKGQFRVLPHSRESANLERLRRIIIRLPNRQPLSARIVYCRRKGILYILALDSITSIEQAQQLVGGEVLAETADLQPLAEGEFYWFEVIGMEVLTDQGRRLGTVASLIPTGANDVLQVLDNEKEILLPNIPDVILRIDRQEKRITVRLLPGLE